MQQLGVGVIGVGDFGEIHVQVLSSMDNVNVVAICDIDEKRVREVSSKYNIKKWYTDHRDLVQDKDVEAVTIATPEHLHLEPTVSAAINGKHILLEKPFATNLDDADKMISAINKADISFMIGHVLKFDTRCAIVKERIKEGKLGTIEAMYARRNITRKMAEHYIRNTSPILDAGIHDIDLMLWYIQNKVERVYTEAENFINLPYPNVMAALLKFKSGAIGIVENFCNLPNSIPFPFNVDARMEVVGSSSVAYLNFSDHCISFCGERGWENTDTIYWPDLHGRKIGDLKEEMMYFTRCVLEGKKPELNTAEEARASLEVALACDKSYQMKKPIMLPLK